jgi:N-acetylglucosaminyldiphosphoundecaprenol N-acetyl-beta-D-mannosaminyltransferase
MTRADAVDTVDKLIRERTPSYFITANTHYAMLTRDNPDLNEINEQAAFVLADGAPVVWASRLAGTPLPERVAGSDLIFDLCERGARQGYRVFLLGGEDGVGEGAARRLIEKYPGLQIVGVESPPFREPTSDEHHQLIERIQAANPDILLIAFGQPKGERWMFRNYRVIGVPVSVQVGASLDFAAGRIRRAPLWVQKIGMEWSYRLWLEPRRLFSRYARNALFIATAIVRDQLSRFAGSEAKTKQSDRSEITR